MNTVKQSDKQSRYKGLKPFKKGQSGNPKGRPKKEKCIPDILRNIGAETLPPALKEQMRKIYPDIKREMTHLEAAQRLIYYYAFKGESWAFQYIADRTEGKPKQSVDITERTGEIIIIE